MLLAMMQECLKASHSGVTTDKECKSGLNLQYWSYIRPVSETAFQACFMSLVKWSWVM